MAKDKGDKKAKKEKKAKKKDAKARTAKTATAAKSKIADFARDPLVQEIVAATLVATAAALRDPKKAKAMAESAGAEIKALATKASDTGSGLWTLAQDVARRSIDSIGKPAPEAKPAARKPAASKPKPAARKKPAAKPSARKPT